MAWYLVKHMIRLQGAALCQTQGLLNLKSLNHINQFPSATFNVTHDKRTLM